MKGKGALLHKIPFYGEFRCSWWWVSGKKLRVCSKLEKLCSPECPMGAGRKDCRWAQCGHPCVDNEWETCTVVYTERKTLKSVMKGQMKKESVIIQQNIKDSSGPSFLLRRQVTISLPWNHSRSDGLVGRENWCLRHFWLQCFKLSIILRSLHPNMKLCNEHRELLRARSALPSYFLKSKPERKYQLSGACQTLLYSLHLQKRDASGLDLSPAKKTVFLSNCKWAWWNSSLMKVCFILANMNNGSYLFYSFLCWRNLEVSLY